MQKRIINIVSIKKLDNKAKNHNIKNISRNNQE